MRTLPLLLALALSGCATSHVPSTGTFFLEALWTEPPAEVAAATRRALEAMNVVVLEDQLDGRLAAEAPSGRLQVTLSPDSTGGTRMLATGWHFIGASTLPTAGLLKETTAQLGRRPECGPRIVPRATFGACPPPEQPDPCEADPYSPATGEPAQEVILEQMPQLTGGLASVQERVVYPEAAKRAGVQGVALVHFVVDEQGRVACGEVAMAPSAEIGIAAMEAVSHAAFRPGIQDGKPVKVRFMLPIVFRLR